LTFPATHLLRVLSGESLFLGPLLSCVHGKGSDCRDVFLHYRDDGFDSSLLDLSEHSHLFYPVNPVWK